jgi:outer membrane immunogenic protein
MKKLLLASVGITVLALSGAATAADLSRQAPVYKAAPPAASVYNWTGCYVGGNAGGMWVQKDWSYQQAGTLQGRSDGSDKPTGFLGGVQAGCDYQFAGGFVIGIAGDYDWSDASASHASVLFPGYTDHSKVNSLSSVTGRVGYAWDRYLGYVKGGGAWERDEYSYSNGLITGTASQTRSGWTVGIGGEYAFSNYLSGFVEYDYYDFGDRNLTFVDRTGSFNYGIKETKSVVKAGLNLRWGALGGPGARY